MSLSPHLLASRLELEQHSASRAAGIYYGDGRLLVRLLGEFLAFVDTRDRMVGPRLALDGFWESWVTLAIARYLQRGFWCVDVGANYGYYTLLMAGACGPEGRAAACEANPILAEAFLPQNLALNGFSARVEICPKVMSNRDAPAVDFHVHEEDWGTSSLERWAHHKRSRIIPVPALTLDQLCAAWPRLDLVKIDAEGAETLIWEGMQETLRRFPGAAVVLELHVEADPEQAGVFLRRVEREGYALRFINYEGEIVATDRETVLRQPKEHWAMWLQR